MALTPAVVRYAAAGCSRDADGRIVRRAPRVRQGLARRRWRARFLAPAPAEMLDALVARRAAHRRRRRELARRRAGGRGHHRRGRLRRPHRQPAARRAVPDHPRRCATSSSAKHGYDAADPRRRGGRPRHAGARSPRRSRWARPTCSPARSTRPRVESGSSDDGARRCWPQAELADVTMAPAADMFEMGVKVQVLKRGTMFADARRQALRALRGAPGLEAHPGRRARAQLEKDDVPRAASTQIWADTPATSGSSATRARSTRGRARPASTGWRWCSAGTSASPARWANAGEPTAALDYQIWCGPAMGAFNAWAAGSFLADPAQPHRRADRPQPARRAPPSSRAPSSSARTASPVPAGAFDFRPRPARAEHACSQRDRNACLDIDVTAGRHRRHGRASSPARCDSQGFWRDILARARPASPTSRRTHWLIEDYYDPDPAGARQDLLPARRASSPDVAFDPLEFGVPPNIAAGDRHRPAARR